MRSRAVFRKSSIVLWLALVVVNFAIAWLCGKTWEVTHKNLDRHGQWIAAKTQLTRRVPFDAIMLATPQAMARGWLDLGAWAGDHELLLKRPMIPRLVLFDARLTSGSFCAFSFNGSEKATEGFLLSADSSMPSCFYRADADQRFVAKRPASRAVVTAGAVHHVRLEFQQDCAKGWVDNVLFGEWTTNLSVRRQIGFRGGTAPALVGGIVIEPRDGVPERIPMTDLFLLTAGALTAWIVLLAFYGGWFIYCRRRGVPWIQLQFMALSLSVVAICAGAAALVICKRANYGGQFDPRRALENVAASPYVIDIIKQIDERLLNDPKRLDRVRVMLIGGSQIHGLGAGREDAVVDRQLEGLLAEKSRKNNLKACEVINAGVTALRAKELFALYEEKWAAAQPDIVILNVGNNDQYLEGLIDKGGRRYRAALEDFVRECQARKTKLFFSLEANSPERDVKLSLQHAIMREVAAAHGIPVIDANEWLRQRYADGFLWRDYVHLSSFGQSLLAGCFSAALEKTHVIPVVASGSR